MICSNNAPFLYQGMENEFTDEQADFFSGTAFLEQGAPYLAAVLAYAVGNQTIAQRLFAVRQDKIKATFITATLGYGGTVIGLALDICSRTPLPEPGFGLFRM